MKWTIEGCSSTFSKHFVDEIKTWEKPILVKISKEGIRTNNCFWALRFFWSAHLKLVVCIPRFFVFSIVVIIIITVASVSTIGEHILLDGSKEVCSYLSILNYPLGDNNLSYIVLDFLSTLVATTFYTLYIINKVLLICVINYKSTYYTFYFIFYFTKCYKI